MRWMIGTVLALGMLGWVAIDFGKPFYAWVCYVGAVVLGCAFLHETQEGSDHLTCSDDEEV